MDNAKHIVTAVVAGAKATAKEDAGEAIRDRYAALKKAVGGVPDDPATLVIEEASDEMISAAKELLGLIKVDEKAREAVAIEEVEAALVALSAVEVEAPPPPPEVPVPHFEESKTELERQARPFWKRTDRYFFKVGVVVAIYFVVVGGYWLFVRTPPDASLVACRGGSEAECWRVVAKEDEERKEKPTTEPLELLCSVHQDPCACAGLAYVTNDCDALGSVKALDPNWACQCKRYDYWRTGMLRMPHCAVPRCN